MTTDALTGIAAQPTDLLGIWSLERRVLDRVAGLAGRVTGTLELAADGADVSWFERGTMRWQGQELAVTRQLRIRPMPEGWLVCFSDGRQFHPWQPGLSVVHPCRADTYRGLVVVDADRTRLRIGWQVTGPTKDQRLITCCRRLGAVDRVGM